MLKGKNKTQKDIFTFCDTIPAISVKLKTSLTHKMPFNSKSTPTSPNLQRTTYYFVQKKENRQEICLREQNYKRFYTCFHTVRESVWPVTPCVFLTLSGISSLSYNFPTNNAWCLPFPIIKTKKKRFFFEKSVDEHTKLSN